ncbi:IS5 family transposase domain protein [Rickettsiales endosymbiont of Paramecium tredecaurelia]|nr:IS5 family transposase domain protein [Candidatus Sarmatiella mevalonica]
MICTAFSNGKRHDFRLFKESKTKIYSAIKVVTDTKYQGIRGFIINLSCQKKTKKNPLTNEGKKKNRELAR